MPSTSRRALLASVVAGGAAAVAGCFDGDRVASYRSFGYDARNRGANRAASGPSTTPTERWRFPAAQEACVPVVAAGRVLVATTRRDDRVVVALDAADGSELWTYEAGARVGPGWYPALDAGTLYFLDGAGTVHAVTAGTGHREWTRALGVRRGVPLGIATGEDSLVFGLGQFSSGTQDGLYCLEQANGTTRWQVPPEPRYPHTPGFPAVDGGTVYYGSVGEPTIYARSLANGSLEWATSIGTGGGYQAVALAGDHCYARGLQEGLVAIDRESRTVTWRSPADVNPFPPAVDGERVYHAVGGERGVSLQATTRSGRDLWRTERVRETFSAPPLLPPTIAGRTLYYGDPRGRLRALEPATGEELWGVELPTADFETPAVVDGSVFVTSRHGLSAFRA